jgi:protein-S-isoprenylcysteine O-methyltransferase Ste14
MDLDNFIFLIPLVIGFAFHIASSFTSDYSEKYGAKAGTFITILFRDILGIPVWAIGILIAVRDSGELLYYSSMISVLIGWTLLAAGGLIIIIALVSIRRKSAAPTTRDSLVHTGIYSVIRHPIHAGTFLEFAGIFVLWPSLNVGISAILGIAWIYIQSRAEEKDLLKRMPAYGDYMKNVPRFIPRSLFS